MIYDTGSGSFLVRSTLCTGCASGTTMFDVDASSTFNYVSPARYKRESYYDGTVLEGRVGTDIVCVTLDSESCAEHEFVALDYTYNLSSYEDGILGMWSGRGQDVDELWMYSMIGDTSIVSNTFSFFLTGKDGASYIDFGEPDTAAMSDPNDLIYIDV